MATEDKKKQEQKQKEIKELVIARLEILPFNTNISIGSKGSFSKDQLLEHVKKDDSIGKKIIEIELEYLKLLKEGFIYEQNSSDNQAIL